MGIPEKCWRGCWHRCRQKWGCWPECWHRCWQKWGCWPECWHRCWQVGPFGKTETRQPASTCASTLASTPIFASTCASTPASTSLEFPFWGPVPGRWDLKPRQKALGRWESKSGQDIWPSVLGPAFFAHACPSMSEGQENHTTNLEMAKSTRGTRGGANTGVQQAYLHNRNCLQLVPSEGLKTEGIGRTKPVSPSGICEENVVCRSGKWDEIQRTLGSKSSEKRATFPPFTLPLVVLDFHRRNGLFFFYSNAKFCASALRLGSVGGATENSWRGQNSCAKVWCRWSWPACVHKLFGRGLKWSALGHPKEWVSFRDLFCLRCGTTRPKRYVFLCWGFSFLVFAPTSMICFFYFLSRLYLFCFLAHALFHACGVSVVWVSVCVCVCLCVCVCAHATSWGKCQPEGQT